MILAFALELGMPVYLSIAGAGGVVAALGLVLRKPLAGTGAVPGWLAGGISGFLLGLGIAFVLMFQLGYRWSEQPPVIQTVDAPEGATGMNMSSMMSGMGGGMGGGASGGGGPGGRSGGPSGGQPGGGAGGPSGGQPGGGAGGPGGGRGGPGGNTGTTPALLETLVRKLDLLSGGMKIELTSDQVAKLLQALDGVEKNEYITPDDVSKRLDACMAALTEEQKALISSIDLPRRPRPQGAAAAMPGDIRPPPNPFKEHGDELLKGLRSRANQSGK